jgi:hypothetical protein
LGEIVMAYLKMRLLALVLILISIFLVYINWRQLRQEGTYSIKLAAFGPLIGVGGLFVLLFPARGGKPDTTGEKLLALLAFVIGVVAGLINWYLMDPGFFSWLR